MEVGIIAILVGPWFRGLTLVGCQEGGLVAGGGRKVLVMAVAGRGKVLVMAVAGQGKVLVMVIAGQGKLLVMVVAGQGTVLVMVVAGQGKVLVMAVAAWQANWPWTRHRGRASTESRYR